MRVNLLLFFVFFVGRRVGVLLGGLATLLAHGQTGSRSPRLNAEQAVGLHIGVRVVGTIW